MPNDFLELGYREVWNQQFTIGLGEIERARHLYLLGMTGTGKSTLISNLVRQDIERGAGVTIIDPHGDLAEDIIDAIPTHRIDDVVILDPTDHDYVPGLNLFYRVPIDDRPMVASNVVETFKHVWADSWGPRLEYILYNGTRLVLDSPDALRPSLVSIPVKLLMMPVYMFAGRLATTQGTVIIKPIKPESLDPMIPASQPKTPDAVIKKVNVPTAQAIAKMLSLILYSLYSSIFRFTASIRACAVLAAFTAWSNSA